MAKNLNLFDDGYDIIDNFLDDSEAEELLNIISNIDFYKKSKDYWPVGLYAMIPDESDDKKRVTETENINVGYQFIWSFDTNEKKYLDEKSLIGTPAENYSKNIRNLISKFQDKCYSFLSQNNFDVNKIKQIITLPYECPAKSSILWHDDTFHSLGISYYLNKSWGKNCGGELLLESGKWVFPVFNRAVFIGEGIEHKVCNINPGCPSRYSLQSFILLK